MEYARLGESSRRCRYQMDMIGHTVAADSRKIGVHSGPDVGVQPWVAVFCAEYGVKDNFARNRALSAGLCVCIVLGRCPRLIGRPRRWR
jgi:hypothetical protein